MVRSQPNIIITGTPGVGKTSHCDLLAQATGLKHLLINHLVKERGCHNGYDEEFQSWVVDEDKVRPCGTEITTRLLTNGVLVIRCDRG